MNLEAPVSIHQRHQPQVVEECLRERVVHVTGAGIPSGTALVGRRAPRALFGQSSLLQHLGSGVGTLACHQPQLLRLRQTANVQRLVAQHRPSGLEPPRQPGLPGLPGLPDDRGLAAIAALWQEAPGGGGATAPQGRGDNGWSWYCRTANPTARMEAITSRPLLLAAVGRAAHSGGQTTG